MGLVRIANPNELRAGHIVLLVLIALALAGTCFLTSAGKPAVLPDGAVAWNPDSLLLALVEILDLQYAQPTPNGVAVKGLVFGAISGVALLVVALGLSAWARGEREAEPGDAVIDIEQAGTETSTDPDAKKQLDPIRTAQTLMLLYVIWSLASTFWSDAPDYAFAGGVLLAGQAAWAFALGFGLNRRAAVHTGQLLLIVLALCGALAIAYHAQRNPTLRASYPIGNPLFLASCLLPGIIIAIVVALGGGLAARNGKPIRGIVQLLLALVALAIVGYAGWLTRSRGPTLGAGLAVAALVFFASGKRVRIAIATVTLIGVVAVGATLFSQRFADSATGRSASMRLRLFSWPYALELFAQHPFTGGGEAYYTLTADMLAIADVVEDPAPLEERISHAHCEWLEVAANLGTVGFVLVMTSLVLTLLGGARALSQMRNRAHRLMMMALLASLVGIVVAECFGVALRFEGLPMIFFTVIGAIWALARPTPVKLLAVLGKSRAARMLLIIVAAVLGGSIVEFSRRDFSAARAAYDVVRVFESGEYEQADALATLAYRDRIIPHRKLTAQRMLADVKLRSAHHLQEQFGRRAQLAVSSGVTDPRLRAEAAASREACERKIAEGEAVLADLVRIAPTTLHAGSIAYGFEQLHAVFATLDNDADAVAAHQQAAAQALGSELLRRPFDPELAARYVVIAYDQIGLNESCMLLARPLRLHRPESSYLAVLNHLLTVAGSYETFLDVFDKVAASEVTEDQTQWPDRWTPELLRLGAIIAYAQPDYNRAARYLERATHYYDVLGSSAGLARAACSAELADAVFFQQPLAPDAAIAAAQRALEFAPKSEDGRHLSAQLAQRLVAFHLAAGHEDFARKIVREWTPANTDEDIDTVLSDRYVDVAYSVLATVWRMEPERLSTWSTRALELAPEDAPPWFLAGDVAALQLNEERVLECARNAQKSGGDVENVIGLLERALQSIPTSNRIRTLMESLKQSAPPETQNAPLIDAPNLPPLNIATTGASISTNGK